MKFPFDVAKQTGNENFHTFNRPTPEILDKVQPNHFVKVNCEKEKFWVKVTSIDENGNFHGIIYNYLERSEFHGLYDEDQVFVKRENVFDVLFE